MAPGKKILLVEDEKDFIVGVRALLEAGGHEVLVANDGQEGLNMAKNRLPDLIILDIMMPNIDGCKVCRMLKFDNKYKSIPILMLTAKAQDSDRTTAMECGADDYLLKSANPDILLTKVKELLPA